MTTIPWPLPHVSLLHDTAFEALRREPKKKASGTREREKFGHTGRQYELVSAENSSRRYRLFIRQSTSNPDVFSVGLSLMLPDGDIPLCRYNGAYHGHKNILEKEKLPCAFHQHLATARYVAAGLDIDGFALSRDSYCSVDGALAVLVEECSIEGIINFSSQINLLPP